LINAYRNIFCHKCKGNGGEIAVCPKCKGQGFQVNLMNMGGMTMQMQTPCDKCGGQGRV